MDVRIRPLAEADARTSVEWRNDPEVWRYTGSRPDREILIEDELAWIQNVIADPTTRRFAIEADGEYVGNIYITGIADGCGEYHVFIGDRDKWGKGIARAASALLIEEARMIGLHTLRLEVNSAHAGAISLYKSLGFATLSVRNENLHMELDLRRELRSS